VVLPPHGLWWMVLPCSWLPWSSDGMDGSRHQPLHGRTVAVPQTLPAHARWQATPAAALLLPLMLVLLPMH
jgi:hypothetical protein